MKKQKYLDSEGKRKSSGECVVSDIGDLAASEMGEVIKVYKKALFEYDNKGNRPEAIKILSQIITNYAYNWYTFTDAYMDLADWIRRQNFEGVSESVKRCCKDFLKRYYENLKSGLEKLYDYIEKNPASPPSDRTKTEIQNINKEFEKAEKLYTAFLMELPLDDEEIDFEELKEDLINFRKYAKLIAEESESAEKNFVLPDEETDIQEAEKKQTPSFHYDDKTIKVVKGLCNKHKTLAEIIENGHNAIDRLPKRSSYTKGQIKDMRESLYFELGEIIVGDEDIDKGDVFRGMKLQVFKRKYSNRLEEKIRQQGGKRRF